MNTNESGAPEAKRRNRSSSSAGDFADPDAKRAKTSRKEDDDTNFTSCEQIISRFAPAADPPCKRPKLTKPSSEEIRELEQALGFKSRSLSWREDWNGNLAFADDEIANPATAGKKRQAQRQSLFSWAYHNDHSKRLVQNLVRFVYFMEKIPPEAKRILASADFESVEHIESTVRRAGYDATVLRQDGWVTSKAEQPSGSIGGAFLIGNMIRWQNNDAAVIAFVHDPDIGDLWKAFWLEDMNTFDLEAEELVDARRKWERRNKPKQAASAAGQIKQSRSNGSADFRVQGADEGVVLAASIGHGARPGVFWPARVMHATESAGSAAVPKRSMAKYKVAVVFLSPYWDSNSTERSRKVEGLSEQGNSAFGTGELLQLESVEASGDTIKEYTFDPEGGVDMTSLEVAFRFTGLPKGAFRRFVDGHRMALGLKLFARKHLKTTTSAAERASFGLFDSHPLSVITPRFPPIVLHLPFSFILSQLPVYKREDVVFNHQKESVLDLFSIVESMKPPNCWNALERVSVAAEKSSGNPLKHDESAHTADAPAGESIDLGSFGFGALLNTSPSLEVFFSDNIKRPAVESFGKAVVKGFSPSDSGKSSSSDASPMATWAALKGHGDDLIAASALGSSATLLEWRRLAERLFCRMKVQLLGDKVSTLVLSDSRCNLHLTAGFNFERSVRLPAALKGAQLAGVGTSDRLRLVQLVEQNVVDYVESALLPQVHDSAYLKRMKGRCMSANDDREVLVLTEDSDGAGGEDTRGCRGTWEAAVRGVAAAVSAVNKVVHTNCCNAFCAIRPPGHHAGRKLHAMKAVSNGFCVLNAVASAAIHAVLPVSEGGVGLRRVCIIDFDVHHGNGTQDILCSSHDPRFLYISIHAGGIQVHGKSQTMDEDKNDDGEQKDENKNGGTIFPGRCGDLSPHNGVLNIPLGLKVTSHAVGNALLIQVAPAVDAFAPDIVLLSAGFDAHKNDPMSLGGLSAEDFGHITEVACQLAFKSCSGRVVSVLEGGYGVPCCRQQNGFGGAEGSGGLFCQPAEDATDHDNSTEKTGPSSNPDTATRAQPSKIADLGEFLPDEMDDQVTLGLQKKLEKCHDEGFIECVREHVSALARSSAQFSGW